MAAIHAGCNSVYFEIEQLNMRARSNINFTIEDLGKISKICKESKINNGILEGINSKIQLAKKRDRGYKNIRATLLI